MLEVRERVPQGPEEGRLEKDENGFWKGFERWHTRLLQALGGGRMYLPFIRYFVSFLARRMMFSAVS